MVSGEVEEEEEEVAEVVEAVSNLWKISHEISKSQSIPIIKFNCVWANLPYLLFLFL